MIWPVYFIFKTCKTIYPKIFNYQNSGSDQFKKNVKHDETNSLLKNIGEASPIVYKIIACTFCRNECNHKQPEGNGQDEDSFSDDSFSLTGAERPKISTDGIDFTSVMRDEEEESSVENEAEKKRKEVYLLEKKQEEMDQREIRKNYFLFALADTIINSLVILPILYFSPVFIILFSQISLPLNMFFSYMYLKRRYTVVQFISVSFVIFGIMLGSFPELNQYFNAQVLNNSTISPLMLENDEEDLTPSNINGTLEYNNNVQLHSSHYVFLFFLLLGIQIFASFAYVYKEKIYDKYRKKLDPIYTVAIVATIQIPLSIPSLLFLFIPFPKPAIYIPPNQFLDYLRNGTNLLFENTNEDPENKMLLLWIFMIYVFCVMIAAIIDFILTQRISSTFNVLNNISILTLSVLFMGWKGVAGSAYKKINLYEYLAIALILLAIINYLKGTPKEDDTKTESDGREIINSSTTLRNGSGHSPLNIINGIGGDIGSPMRRFVKKANNFVEDSEDDDVKIIIQKEPGKTTIGSQGSTKSSIIFSGNVNKKENDINELKGKTIIEKNIRFKDKNDSTLHPLITTNNTKIQEITSNVFAGVKEDEHEIIAIPNNNGQEKDDDDNDNTEFEIEDDE